MTETTLRIVDLMEAQGLKASQLEVKAGLPNATINNWINGKKRKDGSVSKTAPSTDSIIKLARYFNVSADYLLCLTDDPKPLKQSDIVEHQTTSTLSIELAKDYRFVYSARLYNAMPNEYRQEVYAYIFGVATGLGLNIKQILGR